MDTLKPALVWFNFYLKILGKGEGRRGEASSIFFKWNQLLKYLYLLKRKAIKSEKKEKLNIPYMGNNNNVFHFLLKCSS